MTLHHEKIDDSKQYEIFDPIHTWKRKKVENFTAKKLLVKLFENGRCIADLPDI
jgi:nicotinate phosphoribosyltransferase